MGKAVMLSIHPKWVGKIVDGEKTIEIRKTKPKIETPFKCYIYHTSGGWEYRDHWCTAVIPPNGSLYDGSQRVIGEFICDRIYTVEDRGNRFVARDFVYITNIIAKSSCLDFDDMKKYADGRKVLYAWHISDLKIYNEPKELSDFYTPTCEKSEKSCEKCKYLVKIDTPDMYEVDCFVANGRNITSPPQSWCYVEEQ